MPGYDVLLIPIDSFKNLEILGSLEGVPGFDGKTINLDLKNMLPLQVYLNQAAKGEVEDIKLIGVYSGQTESGIPIVKIDGYEVDGDFYAIRDVSWADLEKKLMQ